MTPNILGVASAVFRPASTETYAGFDQATVERIAKFEAETKAILIQSSGLARSSQDQS